MLRSLCRTTTTALTSVVKAPRPFNSLKPWLHHQLLSTSAVLQKKLPPPIDAGADLKAAASKASSKKARAHGLVESAPDHQSTNLGSNPAPLKKTATKKTKTATSKTAKSHELPPTDYSEYFKGDLNGSDKESDKSDLAHGLAASTTDLGDPGSEPTPAKKTPAKKKKSATSKKVKDRSDKESDQSDLAHSLAASTADLGDPGSDPAPAKKTPARKRKSVTSKKVNSFQPPPVDYSEFFKEDLNGSDTSDTSDMAVLKVLNVAEKNDAAKNIAALLSNGQTQRKEGLSKFNKIYEFKMMLQGQQADMKMTSVSGHLLGLDFEEKYRRWYSCRPQDLFELPLVKSCNDKGMVNIKKTLEREAKKAKWLVIWTDCDREGENIGFEIIEVCTAVNRNLRILRAQFSEITRQSVQAAINRLVQPNALVSAAVEVRKELDLRIGAAFTRFQTMRLQRQFGSLSDQVISYGPCQFPTLGFVVERYKAIERFVPEPFWKIKVTHSVDDAKVEFTWKRQRLFDLTAAQVYHDVCLENPKAKVDGVTSKPKSKWRPLPMDTIEMEKLASKKLRITAKNAMKIAEKLYTSGYISYPRTETNIFPKEINLGRLVEAQTQDNRWGDFAARVLEEGPHPRAGKKSDQAHPPIHPLKPGAGLTGDEARVYELVTRHFLACVSADALGKETTVNVDINGEKFYANGLMVLERNYLEVYHPYERWSDKEIPNYENIVEFYPDQIELAGGETSPPNLLTEADLIALMDKHGIGTDATHAEHIETVKARQYIGVQEGDKLVPGLLGMALVDGYEAMQMAMQVAKPHLRAELEADLKRICEGTKAEDAVRTEHIAKWKEAFDTASTNMDKVEAACRHYLNEPARQA